MTTKLAIDNLGNRIESLIVRTVVRSLIAAGYEIEVDNNAGEGEEDIRCPYTKNYQKIVASLATTDEEILWARKPKSTEGGWVKILYGNGEDCISDYTTNLESVIGKIDADYCYDLVCTSRDRDIEEMGKVLMHCYRKLDSVAFLSSEGDTEGIKANILSVMAKYGL